MTEPLLFIAGATAVGWFAWNLVGRKAGRSPRTGGFSLPPDVILRRRPLLTEAELHLYNLLRMAVQDHYLVLVRVPLWCLLQIEGEQHSQREALRHLALKYADLALIHPGSRELEQVVLVEQSDLDGSSEKVKRRDVQTALQVGLFY